MNKKIFWSLSLFITFTVAIIVFMLNSHPIEMLPANARDIVVLEIKRVEISEKIDSYLAWVPGEQNSVAAIKEGFSKGDIVYAYDLETGNTRELYDLGEYGLDQRDTIRFFWTADGKRIVLGSGQIFDTKTKSNFALKLPDGYEYLDTYATSPDGKKIFLTGGGENVSGAFVFDIDNEKFTPFQISIDAFTPPLQPAPWKLAFYPLTWSQDGNWFAVETYNPDTPPKSIRDIVPSAIYLISIDGKATRLIASNINGRVIAITFSPDGSKIIWAVANNSGDQSIFIANSDGSNAHEIFSNIGLSSDYNITSNLLWSSDGSRIVYAGPPDKDFNYHVWVLFLGKAGVSTP